jgi:ABC-type Fe3+/spermidine/putrescine transport system ATPase subunit
VVAIDDITLEVHSGELVALLGPSGCGKTTTMRSIAGLERPERGDIFIGNLAMQGVAIHKREVGMVFQDYPTHTSQQKAC